MNEPRDQHPGRSYRVICTVALTLIVVVTGSCRREAGTAASSSSTPALLRVGLGQVSASNPLLGLRQLGPLLAYEGLARTGEDGRMLPSLAESWTLGPDGRSLTVKLRPRITFHDGSAASADVIASIFPGALKAFVGPSLASLVETVKASGSDSVTITFREKTPFLLESLEASIQKPDGVATGPFRTEPKATTELVSNDAYYLGPPSLKRVRIEMFPSIRSAWAEMLRDKIDMLWEVGPDAIDSMQNSTTVALFTFTRRYQYLLVMNPKSPALASPAVRRALGLAVDRDEIVKTALNGYGIASSGPIWPKHWANVDLPKFDFDPAAAMRGVGKPLKLTCLMPPDSPFERIAITLKRQLSAVGVELVPEELPVDELARRAGAGDYDTLLIELISGQSLLRPYLVWHSTGSLNWGKFGTTTSDAALDRVRHAQSDDEYRQAIAGLQQNFMDDPPAIFLAWQIRARAISRRFVVPTVEPGRDVVSTIRSWKPANGDLHASRN